MQKRILFLLVALAFTLTQAANAVVTIGFEINSIGQSPLFEYSGNGTPTVTDDTLSASNTVAFTVRVDGNAVPTFDDAIFTFDANLVNFNQTASSVELQFDGTFTVETSSNELILSASFQNATTLLIANGLFNTPISSYAGSEPLIYQPGPALMPHLPPMMTLGAPQTMGFTIEIVPFGTPVVFTGTDLQDGEFASSFFFNSSASGSAELVDIPEPATLGLLMASILFMGQRSRRSA